MRAVLVTRPGGIEVREVPAPIDDGRALVQVEVAGICGTDVKIVSGGIPVSYPRVLGHEIVGRVVRGGSQGLVEAGSRVLLDPSVACGHCRACRSDFPHLCPNGALMGRDVDGGLAELVAVDELQLLPLPEHLSAQEVALLQVLGTCVHAQTMVEVFPGQTAAIVGLGVSGLLHLQLLRARGVDRVIGISRSQAKLDLAEKLGAVAVATPDRAEEVVEKLTHGWRADLVVEAVGKVETLAQSVRLTAAGGTVLVFGTITATGAGGFPFYQLYHRELTLVNPRAARFRDYAKGVDLAAAGMVQLEPLWSRSFPIDEASAAFEALQAESGDLKVTFSF